MNNTHLWKYLAFNEVAWINSQNLPHVPDKLTIGQCAQVKYIIHTKAMSEPYTAKTIKGFNSTIDVYYSPTVISVHTTHGSTLALARLPGAGASKIPCRASKISKCSNLLAQLGK